MIKPICKKERFGIFWEIEEYQWISENGKLNFIGHYYHREDGPAIEWSDGEKCWYLDNILFDSKEEWFKTLTSERKENYVWNM